MQNCIQAKKIHGNAQRFTKLSKHQKLETLSSSGRILSTHDIVNPTLVSSPNLLKVHSGSWTSCQKHEITLQNLEDNHCTIIKTITYNNHVYTRLKSQISTLGSTFID